MKEKTSNRSGLEIAIIGMAGRFPGAANIQEFWENLKNGIESIEFFDKQELIASGIPQEVVNNPLYVNAGAVIPGIDCFDAAFFDYTPGDAMDLDPQTRLFHECAVHALEDAGVVPSSFNGQIGLFAGASGHPAWEAMVMLSGRSQFLSRHYSDKDGLCTLVSYKLNLKGPSSLVQTACSTSLVAIHHACRSLLTGDCTLALAGGIRVSAQQRQGYFYQEGLVYSQDGHCRAFDAQASGTVPGNGVGIVVLKLLKPALDDHDHIYAVIKGSAANNDGNRKVGYTAPSIEGQAEVIRMAYRMARVKPGTVSFIEAHGTGTPLGDAVEIAALKLAFNSNQKNSCAIGSVKSNIGHLDAAAGVAGLIKATLCIYHRLLVPTLHIKKANPEADLENSPFYLAKNLNHWPIMDEPLRGGVSSFGIGGTNAHVILEEAPKEPGMAACLENESRPLLLVFSAKSTAALTRWTLALGEYLKKKQGEKNLPGLTHIAYTLQAGREHYRYRQCLVTENIHDTITALTTGTTPPLRNGTVNEINPAVIFMFPGQGSQYAGMGHQLYQHVPFFHQEMENCFQVLNRLLNEDVHNILFPQSQEPANALTSDIKQSIYIQPLIFCIEYALARWLIHLGIIPKAMIGYSFGEFSAACIANVFSLEQALEIVVLRARLITRMPKGAMLSVPLAEKEVLQILSSTTWKDHPLFLAVVNPDACIISGPTSEIEAFEKAMKQERLLCLRLNATLAGHSSLMTRGIDELETSLARMTLNQPTIPLVSNITGTWLTGNEAVNPGYWVRLLTDTIRFADGIKTLEESFNTGIFIETGPGRDLSILARRGVKNAENRVTDMLPPPQRSHDTQGKAIDYLYLLQRLGRLWLTGVSLNWNLLYCQGKPYRVSLPGYSFEPQHYWPEVNLASIPAIPGFSPTSPTPKPDEKEAGHLTPTPTTYRERPPLENAYTSAETVREQELVLTWQMFFGIQPIGIDDDFFDLGGDSLKATTLSHLIHQELNIRIPLETFFKYTTIRQLAQHTGQPTSPFSHIEAVEKKEYYQLSSAQKRLFILQQMTPDRIVYNLPQSIPLQGTGIKPGQLEQVFKTLTDYHESLRTCFITIEDEPGQRVLDHVPFDMQTLDPAGFAPGQTGFQDFVRPFDLSQAPLMRAGLVCDNENTFLLMVDIHHIITDGVSMTTLQKQFLQLLEGKTLPALRIQYKDYAGWQNSDRIQSFHAELENYWVKPFEQQPPTLLDLPLDFPRPPIQNFQGQSLAFFLDQKTTAQLKQYAASQGATLYMAFLAVVTIVLAKITGQDDIIVGTPVAGRNHIDLQGVMGMFVNTIVMRNFPQGKKGANEFLNEVKTRALGAFANEDYPFEKLVEKVDIPRDLSRNPLFDVLVALQTQVEQPGSTATNQDTATTDLPSALLLPYTVTRFDLAFQGVETANGISLTMEFGVKLFKESTIQRLVDYLIRVIHANALHTGGDLADIEIISQKEKRELLEEWQENLHGYPEDKTLVELFSFAAAKHAQAVALSGEDQGLVFPAWLEDNHQPGPASNTGSRDVTLTYQKLDEISHGLAAGLKNQGVQRGSIVGLMGEPSLDIIAAILAILKTGAAYLPVDGGAPAERIRYILKDSAVTLLVRAGLSASENPVVNGWEGKTIELSSLMSTGDVFPGDTGSADVAPGSLAYIIYTSGSTGRPKGVAIEHGHVCPLLHWGYKHLALGPGERLVEALAYYFDWSVWEIFITLTSGATLYPVPRTTLADPTALTDIIKTQGITAMHTSPTQYSLLTGNGCYLETMAYLFFGAEKLTLEFLQRSFATVPPSCRVFNMYGPTEAGITTVVLELTGWRETPARVTGITSAPIGYPVGNTILVVTDRDGLLCPVQVPGELAIAGACIARGYVNNLERTAGSFVRLTAQSYPSLNELLYEKGFLPTGGEDEGAGLVFYHTGDRVKRLEDGSLEYLNRLDTQVKLRGFRIELGEIERQLLAIDKIKEAVVVLKKDESHGDYLCAYVVGAEPITVEEIKNRLGHGLPHYMVPAVVMFIERLPLNRNGKVDLKGLPEPQQERELDYTAPADELEAKLAQTWVEILGLNRGVIGLDSDFFHIGGHSLNATRMVSLLHRELGVKIPLAEVFQCRTIRRLAQQVRVYCRQQAQILPGERFTAIEPAEEQEYYECSSAQRRLFFIQQLMPGGVVYNMPMFLPLGRFGDVQLIQRVFHVLLERHESLRTSFHVLDRSPVQRVHATVQFTIPVIQVPGEVAPVAGSLVQPFDLAVAPLLRVVLVKKEPGMNFLFLDIHHIISDGVSMSVLRQEFFALAEGGTLPVLKLQYKDYSQWSVSQGQREEMEKQAAFWQAQFRDEVPVLELPYDFPRPVMQGFAGQRLAFVIEGELAQGVTGLAEKTGVTPFMLWLAIYTLFLAKLGSGEDVVVGVPVAARRHADLLAIVGMFVNTLALRHFPGGERRFIDFLEELRQRTMEAFENQEYPFEELVEQVRVRRDIGRSPLFDVMFVYQEPGQDVGSGTGGAAGPGEELAFPVSRFDMTLTVFPAPGRFLFHWEYSTALFKHERIEQWAGYFKNLVTALLEEPEGRIEGFSLLDEREKQVLLGMLNRVDCQFPVGQTIHGIFAGQVARRPDAVALITEAGLAGKKGEGQWVQQFFTYGMLAREANRLSAVLIERGAEPGSVVGLMTGRKVDMIVGILGILQAGCGYMPVDWGYPVERMRYMLADSAARFLVMGDGGERGLESGVGGGEGGTLEAVMKEIKWQMQANEGEIIEIGGEVEPGLLARQLALPVLVPVPDVSLAYVIYTSGTTGRPKGSMIEHRQVVRLLFNEGNLFQFSDGDTWTLFHSYCFDFSVWEMYGALLYGGRLVIVPGLVTRDPGCFLELLLRERVTVLNQTPAAFYLLSEREVERKGGRLGLRYVIFGGEALSPGRLQEFNEKYGDTCLVNMFGITETTVHVTFKKIEAGDIESGVSNIGVPLPTLSLYIVDRGLNLVPRGVVGEICVGGEGVCRGYLNRPGLTAEKFVNDPFRPGHYLYCSGDMGRLQEGGEVEYLGRRDRQVKIRGYRVETAEIEFHLKGYPGMKDVVVVALQPVSGMVAARYLCAYVVMAGAGEGEEVLSRRLSRYLSGRLPAYMVPSYFVELVSIPLTVNGKVDRQALPHPVEVDGRAGDLYIPPQTGLQGEIVFVWQEVLGRKQVGIRDNFFDLGGTSLDLIQVVKLLGERLGREIPVVDLFTYPTIESLSAYLGGVGVAGDKNEIIPSLLTGVGEKETIEEGKNFMMDLLAEMDEEQ